MGLISLALRQTGIARALLLGYFRFCGLNDRAPWAINCPARFP
jgi:hypothetical protein